MYLFYLTCNMCLSIFLLYIVFFFIFDQLSVCCLYPLIFWKQNCLFKSAYVLGKENWFIELTRLHCHDIAPKWTTKRCIINIIIVHISFALSMQSSSLEVKIFQYKQHCCRKKNKTQSSQMVDNFYSIVLEGGGG